MRSLIERIQENIKKQDILEQLYSSRVRVANRIDWINLSDNEKILLHGSYIKLRNISNKIKTLVDHNYHNMRLGS